MAGLRVTLLTLRRWPYDHRRMTRGPDDWLGLSCVTLSFTTPCRFCTGALGDLTLWGAALGGARRQNLVTGDASWRRRTGSRRRRRLPAHRIGLQRWTQLSSCHGRIVEGEHQSALNARGLALGIDAGRKRLSPWPSSAEPGYPSRGAPTCAATDR